MPDIHRVDQKIEDPATLQVGTSSAAKLRDILAGTAAVDLPSAGTGVAVSASAAAAGLTTNHRVVVMAQGWATLEEVIPVAAACNAAGVLTVTGINAGSATRNATSQTFNYFAWRNG